jgi:hypothetical protein
MTQKTAVQAFQQKFVRNVEDEGIEFALTWIAGSYQELAAARLDDDIARAFGEHAKNPANRDGLVLFLTTRLVAASARIANRSTGAGTNLLMDADVAVTAQRLEKLSSGERSRQWDAFRERVKENAPAQA